ncbi:hypothetical protein HK105_205329 [Polyrhizophydium stewartii]|uniref:Uncharacterized protein n=1 Tax=Polyrhizophydium stewartii TaxID=2732419 RepID=A0ABR4N6Q5_9FUNG
MSASASPDAPQRIASATLNKLVEKLTEEKGEKVTEYLDFVKTFLLTYQSFTTAEALLQLLTDRYAVPNDKSLPQPEFDKFRITIQLRVCNVLLQWIKKYSWDFVHPQHGRRICNEALQVVDKVIAFEHPAMAKQIRKGILKLLDGSATASPNQLLSSWKSTVGVRNDPNGIVFGYSSDEIARQLTMIEEYLFSAIMASLSPNRFFACAHPADMPGVQPSELLNQAWTKKDAAYLDAMGNFSTLMAIIAGLNKAAISRLKQTMKELSAKSQKASGLDETLRLGELERQMSAEGSYKNYRARVRKAEPPWIPYIGTYLIDLTYMEDGNPDMIQNRINFSKRELISGVIREMIVLQQTLYSIKPVEELAAILSNIPEASEDQEKRMWLESKKIE